MTGAIDIGTHMAALTRVRGARVALEALGSATQPLKELDPTGLRQAFDQAITGTDLLQQAGTGLGHGKLWRVRTGLNDALNARVESFTSRGGVTTERIIPPTPSETPLGSIVDAAKGAEREISATIDVARMTDDELLDAIRGIAQGTRSGSARRLGAVEDLERVVESQFARLLSPFNAQVAARRFSDSPKVTAARIDALLGQAVGDVAPEQARAELQALLRALDDDLPTPLQALRINELLHVRGIREAMPRVSDVSEHGAEWARADYGLGRALDETRQLAIRQEVANLRLAIEGTAPADVRTRLQVLTGKPQLTGSERREILAGLVGVPDALGPWSIPRRNMDAGILGGDLLKMQNGVVPWDADNAKALHSVLSIRDATQLRARLIELAGTEGAATDPRVFREVATLARQSEIGERLAPDHWKTIETATWTRRDGALPTGGQRALDAVAALAAQGRRAPAELESLLGATKQFGDRELDQAARLWRSVQLEGDDTYPALRSAFLERLDARMAQLDPLDDTHAHLHRAMDSRARELFTPGSNAPFEIARAEVARATRHLADSLTTSRVRKAESALEPARRLSRAMRWLVDGSHGQNVNAATRKVADDTWEYLRRNIAVMDRTESSVGYANYPDHAELGRALENAKLVVGFTDMPAEPAPVASAAERLIW